MTLTQDRRSALIGGCPLFRGLDAQGLAAVAAAAIEVDFPADRVIAREGEIGTGFFVIIDGMVRVIRDGSVVARLGPGEFFGELSVLDGGPRVAQVTTEVPTRCLALATWDFERVLSEEPRVALSVLRVVAGRLREITADQRT
ncbi:MAG TPA: cyclic nucleotide-binding domain-containing protein [Candidatus Limnocylindrales bacterium]|jgi:CRP-like cAMP-binding protein